MGLVAQVTFHSCALTNQMLRGGASQYAPACQRVVYTGQDSVNADKGAGSAQARKYVLFPIWFLSPQPSGVHPR